MKLILAPDTTKQKAARLLSIMTSRPAGIVGYVDDLFVLDELLMTAPPELEVWSGGKKWDRGLLERIRFERGLDPRPPAPDRFKLSLEDQMRIHDEAVAAVKEGKRDSDNPYPEFSHEAAQWDHSFSEYEEATSD